MICRLRLQVTQLSNGEDAVSAPFGTCVYAGKATRDKTSSRQSSRIYERMVIPMAVRTPHVRAILRPRIGPGARYWGCPTGGDRGRVGWVNEDSQPDVSLLSTAESSTRFNRCVISDQGRLQAAQQSALPPAPHKAGVPSDRQRLCLPSDESSVTI
jgi:hypothetical protein